MTVQNVTVGIAAVAVDTQGGNDAQLAVGLLLLLQLLLNKALLLLLLTLSQP